MVSEADAEAALVETMTAEENPSDTLMVRLIGELEENQIKWLERMNQYEPMKSNFLLTQKSTERDHSAVQNLDGCFVFSMLTPP